MKKNKQKSDRKTKGKSKLKIILWIVILITIISALIIFIATRKNNSERALQSINYYTVNTGNIENSIQGSSTIQAKDMYTITSSVNGEIWSDYFSEGDSVTKGDLMYHIEDTDYMAEISDALEDIEDAKIALADAKNDLLDANDDLTEAQDNMENKNIKAPMNGVISSLKINEEDNVNAGMIVAELFNNEHMLLTIAFNASDACYIGIGDHAEVTLTTGGKALDGTVSRVGSGALANSYGIPVTTIEIQVKNPGGITLSSKATATVGTYACNSAGSFTYADTANVKSQASGEVEILNIRVGDTVKKGDVIAVLDGESLENALKNAQEAVKNAQTRVNSAQKQVYNMQEKYDNLLDKITDYKVEAPITGTVIAKNYKAGDQLDNTSGANTLAVIADLSRLEMEISVDELDIMSVKSKLEELNERNAEKTEGEKPERLDVRITADAVENKTFYGYVENVSIVGTSYTGSTSYPIYVVLENEEDSTEDINDYLIPGMNVTCEIMVESKSDVLLIPVSAIGRGNTVTRVVGSLPSPAEKKTSKEIAKVPENENSSHSFEKPTSDTATAESQTPPEKGEPTRPNQQSPTTTLTESDASAVKTEIVTVTLGITDGSYVEVLSGLSKGDIIVLPDTTASYGESAEEDEEGFGMFGGMPGGNMPGGGMPDGGMPGGNMPGGGMPGGNTNSNRGGMNSGNSGSNRGGMGGMR